MTRPAFFLARLYDFDIAKAADGTERRPKRGVVTVAMEDRDFGTFLTCVGPVPQSDFWVAPDMAPGLILVPSRLTNHPETNAQLRADALIAGLEETLDEGCPVLTQDLVLRLLKLTGTVTDRAVKMGLIERAEGREPVSS